MQSRLHPLGREARYVVPPNFSAEAEAASRLVAAANGAIRVRLSQRRFGYRLAGGFRLPASRFQRLRGSLSVAGYSSRSKPSRYAVVGRECSTVTTPRRIIPL